MLRSRARQLHLLLMTADVALSATIFAGLVAQSGLQPAGESEALHVLALGLVSCLAWPLALDQFSLYRSQRRGELGLLLARLCLVGAITTGGIVLAGLALRAPLPLQLVATCAAIQFAALSLFRLVIWSSLRLIRRKGRNYRNVVILGSGKRAREVRDVIELRPEWGLRIVGFLDEKEEPFDPAIPRDQVFKLRDLPELLQLHVIDEALVAVPRSLLAAIAPAIGTLADAGVPVTLLSDLFGDIVPLPRPTRFGMIPALSFAPVHHGRLELAVKRLLDVAGASVGLLASLPLLAVVSVLIKASSPGPVLFRQTRSGLYGRPFQMLKLRTMYADAEQRRSELLTLNEMDGPVFKIHDDPRITPVGRFLRRYSLDEIPQLWNVLKGHMSLVGPRPPLPDEVLKYQTRERRRLSMRPGLTCLWQVSGRNNIGFEDWVRLDLEYIDSWSLSTDARILLQTPSAVLRGVGAS